MSQFFTGQSITNVIQDNLGERYFYGLRRSDEGELFLGKLDQLSLEDTIQINKEGDVEDNFTDFDEGVEFFEGRDSAHNLTYKNLNYEQFRWDDANLFYYVNDEGELVVRINQGRNDGAVEYAGDTITIVDSDKEWDNTNLTLDNNNITFDAT
jgi:hypothetical protein|tara:strand:+ start:9042 stop:9500 length:459 start_codon:yes stop_codon:yes gene_type:complete